MKKPYAGKIDLRHGRVEMNHGAGGRATAQLVEQLFAPAFDNPALREGDDAAVIDLPAGHRLVMSTDAHVVTPRFFPGGDIGRLAVTGTINDVVMKGAVPLSLSASFVLEEGLPLEELARIVDSMAQASREAGVPIVTGDTKVVERGQADGVFITTTGIGALPPGRCIGGAEARVGDVVLISGPVGDHGIAVLSQRESLAFDTPIVSDCAALHGLVAHLLAGLPEGAVHVLRDPTRGGLATTLNEIVWQADATQPLGVRLDEAAIPVRPAVRAACEWLGLDALYIANEGKCVVICAPEHAEAALALLRAHPLGTQAARIGEVVADPQRFVQARTALGGQRLLDWLSGDPLPRIC
jgi:hydrogenase expression/formation protein HypE